MDPPSNMDEQTKKFLYNDDDEREEINRRNTDKNINASQRYTQVTSGDQLNMHSASDIDKSPVFKYQGNNKGDLSPFGGMRKNFS